MKDMLLRFQEIKIETPVDKIIRQIRELITTGQLNPNDRLPPIRELAQRLGVGQNKVREAIHKLEFYGILKTIPQNGTIVSGISISTLEGLITDILKIENKDFASLIETRVLLELEAVRLASERRTTTDIENMKAALKANEKSTENGLQTVEEDLMFHLAIAEASKNSVLKSLMLVITPDITNAFTNFNICDKDQQRIASKEHQIIIEHIIAQESKEAVRAMEKHLKVLIDFSKKLTRK